MINRTASFFLCLCLLLVSAAFAGSCSPRTQSAPESAETGGEDTVFIPDSLLAIVRYGETPLWFELGPNGPAPIPGPVEASEEPFAPWPRARYVAGLAFDAEGRLIMAVNRDGFFAWENRADGLGLYRVSGGEAWNLYTVASLFMYRGTPAALLYRDDFFLPDEAETPVLPPVRVWGLSTDFQKMEETEIPVFAVLPQAEGWDVDTLSLGRDGLWYYRGLRKGDSRPDDALSEVRYFRTWDLSVPGEPSSAGVFRSAMSPYTEKDMPPPIRAVLEEAEHAAEGGEILAAAVVSPEFPIRRHFALRTDGSGEQGVLEIAGFYRSPDTAAVVFPNGRGIIAGPVSAPEVFTLPVLPEGFVYTRIGFAGSALIASWEEQQDWQIGAAGFMIIGGPKGL